MEVAKEQVPPVEERHVSNEWLPEHEQQGDNDKENEQGSNEEDIVVVIIKRRKAKGKLKINENRSRVRNKRVPKNVVVSTENVAMNSKEEEAKWKFVASRRIFAERMMSENTKKNPDIMSILEDAGVMPTVEIVSPYYPKLIREFICNMTEDIDDPESPNFKSTGASFNLGQFIFDKTIQHAQSYAGLNPIAYPSMLCSIMKAQHSDIIVADDEEAPSPGYITISPKLLQGTHVADIPLRVVETGSGSGPGNEETTRFIRNENQAFRWSDSDQSAQEICFGGKA
ncbi:hypothetical protein LIER_29168 [Lithospermum erythrorhizon]|uniref:Uncharacterized protein n=1 Tax=Lithospermum erythrorhizon TaxID=34254 RepID=A0AAV3RLA3_LITER